MRRQGRAVNESVFTAGSLPESKNHLKYFLNIKGVNFQKSFVHTFGQIFTTQKTSIAIWFGSQARVKFYQFSLHVLLDLNPSSKLVVGSDPTMQTLARAKPGFHFGKGTFQGVCLVGSGGGASRRPEIFTKFYKPWVNFSRVWTKNTNCWDFLRDA